MRRTLFAAMIMAAQGFSRAEPPRLALTLSGAEEAALARSPALKAAQTDWEAAAALVDVQLSSLLPRLTLDGSYQYQTQVPKVALSPNAPPLQFGDHRAYSLGPTLSATLWDFGGLRASWLSQKALARSASAQKDLARRQVRLMTRLDYFTVQLALESERSLIDSLKLAQAQYRDIDSRYQAGSASRIDWLSAHQQVLDRSRDVRGAQADVAGALRTLFALTGQAQEIDLSAPLDDRVEAPLPHGVSSPTIRVALEPLESVESRLEAAALKPLDEAYPQALAYEEQARSQELAARSLEAGAWPRIGLSLKSDYLYPNLPLLQSVWQNTALVTATVPLFEFRRSAEQAQSQRALADSALSRRQQALDELSRDWRKARDQFAALSDQAGLERESVEETAEIARLRYRSYRDGGSTILDVETANLNAVQARVLSARTQTQMLIQLATLESLSQGTP